MTPRPAEASSKGTGAPGARHASTVGGRDGRTTVSRDSGPLTCSDAVAAVIVTEDGRYLLQQRDDIKGIWYPDHWGCFGGAVDPGEDERTAMTRELREELGLALQPERLILRMHYEIVGSGTFFRNYFEVLLRWPQLAEIALGEGQRFAVFPGAQVLDELRMTPYDAFAIYLHMRRDDLVIAR